MSFEIEDDHDLSVQSVVDGGYEEVTEDTNRRFALFIVRLQFTYFSSSFTFSLHVFLFIKMFEY